LNDFEVIKQFRYLIVKFKQYEEDLCNALRTGNFNDTLFKSIDDLVIEIKKNLMNFDVLRVDDLSLRNDLIAIRENKEFLYFKLIDSGSQHDHAGNTDRLTFGPNWQKFYKDKWDETLHEQIFPRVNPYALIMKKIELGAILVGKTIPSHLKIHLIRIKECYAWGFETEATIYCRIILEEGFKEALKPKPEFSKPLGKKFLKDGSLSWLLKHSKGKRYFYKEVMQKAYIIKDNINKIVHPTSAKEPEVRISNLEIIKDTYYILEMLFR